jgi:hypothetical protein
MERAEWPALSRRGISASQKGFAQFTDGYCEAIALHAGTGVQL